MGDPLILTALLTNIVAQVMGADADSEGLTGPRKHPFFVLGFKLGPDDPRGAAWFTYQVRGIGCTCQARGMRHLLWLTSMRGKIHFLGGWAVLN